MTGGGAWVHWKEARKLNLDVTAHDYDRGTKFHGCIRGYKPVACHHHNVYPWDFST